ncbi:MAG: TSUP family transporter [Candidatus Pacebacteria bacterium]|nr:TSUP family transporter [Candidatus Paceibacterota bacterium]
MTATPIVPSVAVAMVPEFTVEILSFLFAVAFLAGLIDTIAGGGGLLSVPSLLAVGLSPAATLATNKGQSVFGAATSSFTFLRSGLRTGEIVWQRFLLGMGFSLVGAFLGSLTVSMIQVRFLNQIVPILLIAIAVYTLLRREASEQVSHALLPRKVFTPIFGTGLGFYDGFFGPGTGSFWVVALVGLRGANLRDATVETKFYNFASNLGSLLVFIVVGHMVWLVVMVMAVGQMIGARIGAKLVLRRGTRLIRPLLVVMSLGLTARLIYTNPDNWLRLAAVQVWGFLSRVIA